MSLLQQVVVYLAAAVVVVPLSKRLGLGSVLGYLVAGALIGPFGLRLVGDVENVLHFSEFGVVLLLFLIGLELEPSRLWSLRRTVFGLGTIQVVGTALVLGSVALALGTTWQAAVVIGFALSLSSTAFALQLLGEKDQLGTGYGHASFGILLFQDLAVIPLLAVLPFLGAPMAESPEPTWLAGLKVLAVLAGVILGGRYVVRPLFRVVARARSQELFTASALLLVIGTALVVNLVGLSMALGAFLSGVLLADSEFRHELEADIEPFKGLLLGLFFIAVGMSIHLDLILQRPLVIAALVLGLVAAKALILWTMGRFVFRDSDQALSLAIAISQGGEFAFVLLSLATARQILSEGAADLLVVVVSVSMAVTPLFYALHEKVIRPRLARRSGRAFDVAPEADNPVIIAGFGRVGQVVGRVLRARKVPFTAMDASPEHIDFLKKFGNKIFYGDAARLDLLRAARADKAKVFVLAVDDVEASMRIAETVRQHFPHLTLIARARNRQHAYRLLGIGVTRLMRETFAASVEMTGDVLTALGVPAEEVRSQLTAFRKHDEELLLHSSAYQSDLTKLQEINARSRQELESLFQQDVRDRKTA